jgi:hypothetical protein
MIAYHDRMQVIGRLAYPHLTHTWPPFNKPQDRRFMATLVPSIDTLFEIRRQWKNGVIFAQNCGTSH